MLDIGNLTVQYGQQTPAVHNFNLHMQKGDIVGIVGESGSGKTTVIKAVMGALPQASRIASGSIQFQGKSLLNLSPDTWRSLRGTKLSMIFQDCGGSLNPIRTVGHQFVEYIRIHQAMSKKDAWVRAVDMLEKMRLPDSQNVMNSYPHQLSGGMRQRVGIAMAMTFDPDLLLGRRAHQRPGCHHPGANCAADAGASGSFWHFHHYRHPQSWGGVLPGQSHGGYAKRQD